MISFKRLTLTKEGLKALNSVGLSVVPKAFIGIKNKTNFEEAINDFKENQDFDQKMKARMAQTVTKDENEKILRETEETLEMFQKEFKPESILRTIRNQILLDETDSMTKAKREQFKMLQDEAHKHFSNITNEEFLERAENLKEKLRLKQDWQPKKDDSIFADYGNYNKFNKNFAKIRDRAANTLEDDMEPHEGANLVKFVKNLGPTYAESSHVNEELNDAIDDDRKTQDEVVNSWEEESKVDDFYLYGKPKINFGEKLDDEDWHPKEEGGRMSPWAKEELFDLFNKGWSVRDLSIRFGILPERVKVIIWCKKYYYEEIMPRIDLATVKLALEAELIYGHEHGWQDFGMDLDELAYRESGIFVGRFHEGPIDTAKTNVDQKKLKEVIDKKGKKKYDIVIEKFVGEGNKGYLVKDWKVYRGHGSERVNERFRDIVQKSDKPHMLPDKIRKKLHRGPRIASLGYGIK